LKLIPPQSPLNSSHIQVISNEPKHEATSVFINGLLFTF